MPLGPAQQYLAQYNGYQLPGYVQNESFDSQMNIAQHYAAYADGSLSEYTGLQNKRIPLRLKVWEQDYLTCKLEIEKAATILRSKRSGWAKLYVQHSDKYYEAQVETIKTDKTAGSSTRTLEYEVEFNCQPWLIGETVYTISGTVAYPAETIDADLAYPLGRTLYNGGWTPTTVTITGTNVTVSGWAADDLTPTGFISVSGAVTNLIVDTYNFTATIGSTNANDRILNKDYQLWVAPGNTYFAVGGSPTLVKISWQDRWYL